MLRVRVLPGLNGERDIRGTEDMKRIISFFQESYAELKKVTWPSREEALASTRVVLVSTILIALMLGAVDFILFKLVDWVF
jgi:preprotein translocase subunit SecE